MKLGVVMDSIDSINYKKDSTLSMLWEAETRGYEIYYFEQRDLFMHQSLAYGNARQLKVMRDPAHWYMFGKSERLLLKELDLLLMRKDPPFNEEYIYTTYILEQAEREGVLVANRPQSLRDSNEKLFTTFFPQCTPPTIVTQSYDLLRAFWEEHNDIVCKPLSGMGGASVFRLQAKDVNASVIFETLTHHETRYIMAQRFIPEITEGDKRILMIDGNPVPLALARVPAPNDWRGNLAAGATGVVKPLSKRDQWICEQVGPTLRARGLYFVGLDVIGDYLTEINVTSPTCIREIEAASDLNISAMLFNALKQYK